jgi:SAM-dependent methyltransferase
MPKKVSKSEPRTLEQLRKDYGVEKELADKLRNASKEERRYLYTTLYNELFRRVAQLTRKKNTNARSQAVCRELRLLRRLLNHRTTFMEVGCGDCKLAFEVSKFVRKVYGVDVSEEVGKGARHPENFELIISDGSALPVLDNSIDIAYSNQLMEHLHPNDAFQQLSNIFKALTVGGVYVCITPNRLTGPHDISKYFDEVATGFHLKEYTTTELVDIFRNVGFSKVSTLIGFRGFVFPFPITPVKWLECVMTTNRLSRVLIKKMSCWLPIRSLLGVKVIAIK